MPDVLACKRKIYLEMRVFAKSGSSNSDLLAKISNELVGKMSFYKR